jgi:hypothetical protein
MNSTIFRIAFRYGYSDTIKKGALDNGWTGCACFAADFRIKIREVERIMKLFEFALVK